MSINTVYYGALTLPPTLLFSLVLLDFYSLLWICPNSVTRYIFFCSCGFTNVTLHWAVVNAILNIVKECQTKPVSCLVVWLGWALASIWTHAFPQCCAYCHWHDYVILEHERIICIDLSLCIHFCWDECMTWLFTVYNKGTCTCTNWLSSNC